MTETLAMDCDELVELVTEYLEASLDPDTRARVEAHVSACPGCTEILEQFRATIALTGALRPADAAAVDPGRRAELLSRFREWKRSQP
jgi:anti-sigma factor RsiW